MDVKLIAEKGLRKAQVFRLRAADTVVGRRRGCNLRIPLESVSRRHCRLTFRDDYLTVEDLASVNGTLVNGQTIAKPTIVHPGDRITIGSITFLVQYQLSPKGIGALLEAQQQEEELMPIFDADESSKPVPLAEDEEVQVVEEAEEAPVEEVPVVIKNEKPPKKKSQAPTKKVGEEQNPNASIILEGRGWELPSGEDLRDILSQLEKE
jgi:pSer/pThr/pTyr-binding forkhead associated (FHA) protein